MQIKQLRNVDIYKDGDYVTIQLNEKDGNQYGTVSDIKIPAKSYEMLEREIVDKWLEKQKLD